MSLDTANSLSVRLQQANLHLVRLHAPQLKRRLFEYYGESNGGNFYALTGPDAARLYILAFGVKYTNGVQRLFDMIKTYFQIDKI
ncbi:hypothetical protein T4B_8391 [Trichinella pseudospiralis]|uniref:Uncharacterized protein n=1 Tax=Trichinella pseudospiralis TaxID=6337 RepID=A0A0V1GJH6_TRIPS|nr:hypothetical protein T4B_8391 [Trichinella pseudospiralis]